MKWTIETLCYFSWGQPFHLVLDHLPIWWLNAMKDHNPQIIRWYPMQPYKFEILRQAGHDHKNMEFFSWDGGDPSAQTNPPVPSLRKGVCDELTDPALK